MQNKIHLCTNFAESQIKNYPNTTICLKQVFALNIYWEKRNCGGESSQMGKHIGFVSTRFSGTDGVTLEASKWAEVFKNNGHACFWFAGELDRNPNSSFLVPEAHFKNEINAWIGSQVFGRRSRIPLISDEIHNIRVFLKKKLYQFIEQFGINLLIVENALTIPMHIPLGLALTEVIAETALPTICHHHDFYWERSRFSLNGVNDYLRMSFPPALPNIRHMVINSIQQGELSSRTGISSDIIPNVMNFSSPPKINRKRSKRFRDHMGLRDDDIVVLQPTRIVQRKGIEHAVQLVKGLNDKRVKLLVSHEAGDEGYEYVNWLKTYAHQNNVDLRLVNVNMADPWNDTGTVNNGFSLFDVYPNADLVTYPSLLEGFGNAFVEAVYFKKPILVNRYATFIKDIEPLGFQVSVMDGFLTTETIEDVKEVLFSPERKERMVDDNYRLASTHYSYGLLRRKLNAVLFDFFGESIQQLHSRKITRKNVVYLHMEDDANSRKLKKAQDV